MTQHKKTGTLFLIPNTLGPGDFNASIPSSVQKVISELTEFIVEDIRSARRYLKTTGYSHSFDDVIFHELNKHTRQEEIPDYLNSLLQGKNVGLISEAGVPCVADPGAQVVNIAHQFTIKVVPLVGPSSILLALMASGMNGQNFAFNGYLPIEKNDRRKKIKELEILSANKNQTQIFIETPYRNKQLFDDILRVCNPNTSLCVATDITLESETIRTLKIAEWQGITPDIQKKNTVFLILKN